MTVLNRSDVYYDPYDVEINADPYPIYRRLREEAPLYYNEPYDFFAVSRFDDVTRGFLDPGAHPSGRGDILELIKSDMEIPPGTLIFEDPPRHTIYRLPAVPGVHTQAGGLARAEDTRVLRPQPRPPDWRGRVRLHR